MLGLGWLWKSPQKTMIDNEIRKGLEQYHKSYNKNFKPGDYVKVNDKIFYVLNCDETHLNVVSKNKYIKESVFDIYAQDIEIISEEEAPSDLRDFANDGSLKNSGFVRLRKGINPRFYQLYHNDKSVYHDPSYDKFGTVVNIQEPFKIIKIDNNNNMVNVIAYDIDGIIRNTTVSKNFLTSV